MHLPNLTLRILERPSHVMLDWFTPPYPAYVPIRTSQVCQVPWMHDSEMQPLPLPPGKTCRD